MASETKQFIEISDLLALQFTCKHCGATLSLLLVDDKLTKGENSPINMFLGSCPSCNRSWAETDYERAIKMFTSALARLRQPPPAKVGFALRLEIEPESAPVRA